MKADAIRCAAALLPVIMSVPGAGWTQTPEQQQLWDAQRDQAAADERSAHERILRERAARQADPMSWVRTLNPMASGGWEFRAVADDGSWAAYSTLHQMRRTGRLTTVWLRQEYAEPQTDNGHRYSSVVEKVQYDCAKTTERALLLIYYSDNNLHGSEETEEADEKDTPWSAIVPGTRDDLNFQWACIGIKR